MESLPELSRSSSRPSPSSPRTSQSLLWAGLVPGCVLGWSGGGRGLTFAVKTYGFCTIWNSSTGVTGAAGAAEVVARPAARTPHPTRAGGQDDGSYTNSLKTLGSLPSPGSQISLSRNSSRNIAAALEALHGIRHNSVQGFHTMTLVAGKTFWIGISEGYLIFGTFLNMIAIWGNKEHFTCVFLFGSLTKAQNLKNTSPKIPSLLSAHAGSYIYCIKNTNIDAPRLNAVQGFQGGRYLKTKL